MKKQIHLASAILLLTLSQISLAARPTAEEIATRRANSIIAKIADTLTPGTWAKVPIINFTTHQYLYNDSIYNLGLLTSPPPSRGLDILGWTDDSHWDSLTGQYLHMGMRQTRKFISYSEASNSWSIIPLPFNHDSAQSPHIESKWGHIYANNAFDIENSRFYHHAHGGVDMSSLPTPARICYYDLVTKEWTLLPNGEGLNKESAIEYFSAMKGLVTLHQKSYGGQLNIYSDSLKRWQRVADSLPVCGYHSTGRHNPYREEILFAGGNYSRRVMIRLKNDGTVERLADSPIDMGVNASKITVDPVSGCYLISGADSSGVAKHYEFDSDNNTYRSLPVAKIWGTYDMPVCTFVPEYKVAMWTYGNKVFLYKHDRAEPPTKTEGKLSGTSSVDFSVYPNPVNNAISFRNFAKDDGAEAVLYNASGRMIESINLSKVNTISIGNKYPNGVYFAKLRVNGKMVRSVRFLIAK